MPKMDEKPAGAALDVRFRLPDGRVVDLPAMRWVIANRSNFAPRMTLSAFLRIIPLWLIKDIEQNASRADSGAGADADVPSSATILALEHLRMWSATRIDSMADAPVNFPENVHMFEAACGLETLRRHGVLKVHVRGDDRLGRDQQIAIELNPVVMAELMKRGPVPIDPDDFVGQFADLIHIAVKTDWAGSEALQDENMT